MIEVPHKPFDSYKWRWLSVAPSENLLRAPVFLGVLRALAAHEGEAFSDPRLFHTLADVERETRSAVTLARDPDRNLFRNSGQYWRGTGLITADRGDIRLTSLGRRLASGQVTADEFAALMVSQTKLPNPATYPPAEVQKWRQAGLELRPLKIILDVIEGLGRTLGPNQAWLTNNELVSIIIPLTGAKRSLREIVQALREFRLGDLDVSAWPNCAPAANDRRLAREFLLFLANFGVLRLEAGGLRDDQRFVLDALALGSGVTILTRENIFQDDESASRAIEEVRHSSLPSIIERQRALATVVRRKGQARFRALVLEAYTRKCWVTGEELPEVLEAAHIVPVSEGGADTADNAFCLRVDIHRLYDSNNLRIDDGGLISLSEAADRSENYRGLKGRLHLPHFVKPANVSWRNRYG